MSQSLGKSGQIEGQSGKPVWTECRLFMEGRRVGQSRKAGRDLFTEAANHFLVSILSPKVGHFAQVLGASEH